MAYKRDCFAFRNGGRVEYCDALAQLKCDGCPFYKPADELEYYEVSEGGRTRCGYINKRAVELARLLALRKELDRQINAIR